MAVPPHISRKLFEAVSADPATSVTINLAEQTLVLPDGSSVKFPVDEFAKQCMLQGVDELGYILHLDGEIKAYEDRRPLTVNTLAAV